jgi:hypothetical protein
MEEEPNSEALELANRDVKTGDIFAAQKIIADISSGIYRSPAAALKELISNAYDADAKRVTISTDPPRFHTLTIEDNGSGMTIEAFLDVLKHIGGSRKRVKKEESDVFNRKYIGRIGIGLLAVSQLGNRFYVSSSVRGSPTKFLAEINLDPFHKDDTALRTMAGDPDKVHLGAIRYVDSIPERLDAQYTAITVPDAKEGLISEFTGLVRRAVGATEVLDIEKTRIEAFFDLVTRVQKSNRADLVLDGYYYMLWELGLLCPLNYIGKDPFSAPGRSIDGEAPPLPYVDSFEVIVDGISLRRPQYFPNPVATEYYSPDPKVYPLQVDQVVAERRLALTGYIYTQQPRIQPEEFKGVHIRIRNVGIGLYDKSWLGYPFDEGLKFGQVTGEIIVTEGLESALNIDRDSFRETDVHYQVIRAYVWNTLRNVVFPDFKRRQKVFRQSQGAVVENAAEESFRVAVAELPGSTAMPPPGQAVRFDDIAERLNVATGDIEMIVQEYELTVDAARRFKRVLTALAASELFTDSPGSDLLPLYRAIAAGIY